MKLSFYSAGFLLLAAAAASPIPMNDADKDKPCPDGQIRIVNPAKNAWVCGSGRGALEHSAASINTQHEHALQHHAAGTSVNAGGKSYPDPLHSPGTSIHESLGGHGEVQHYPLVNPNFPKGPTVYNGGKPHTKDRLAYTVDKEKGESKFLGVVTHSGAAAPGRLVLGEEQKHATPPGSPSGSPPPSPKRKDSH